MDADKKMITKISGSYLILLSIIGLLVWGILSIGGIVAMNTTNSAEAKQSLNPIVILPLFAWLIWALTTGIGILKLRKWALNSLFILSGLCILTGWPLLLIVWTNLIFFMICLFLIIIFPVLFILHFRRKKVKEQFE